MPDQTTSLDNVIHALADPTRRAVLQHLSAGTATVTELSEPFDMALQSFSQHLGVLEACGLIKTQKVGRRRTCQLAPEPLDQVDEWIGALRQAWEFNFKRLDALLGDLRTEGKDHEDK